MIMTEEEMDEQLELMQEDPYDDYCDECSIYGDDYFINDDGELECYCPQCPFGSCEDEE